MSQFHQTAQQAVDFFHQARPVIDHDPAMKIPFYRLDDIPIGVLRNAPLEDKPAGAEVPEFTALASSHWERLPEFFNALEK